MHKGQLCGMEHLTEGYGDREDVMSRPAVLRVADDRMSKVGHMNADLMGTPGFNMDAEQRGVREFFLCFVIRDRITPDIRFRAHLFPVVGISANKGLGATG